MRGMEWRISSILVPYYTRLQFIYSSPLRLPTRSVTLSYKVLGDDDVSVPDVPPIFILHGFLGMKKHWESLGKTMLNMTKRSVVVVDQRNHGDSPHVNSHKYDELASDVIKLLDKLSVEKTFLVGHSMGGKTSMCVSLLAPQRVTGLLVVDISPITTPQQFIEFMPKVLTAMKTVKFHPKNVRKAVKLAKLQLKGVITDDVMMRDVLSNIRVNSNGTIGWACNVDIFIKQFNHLVSFPKEMKGKKYRGPSLFVGGQNSEHIPYGMEKFANRRMTKIYTDLCSTKRVKYYNFHVKRTALDLAYKIQGQCSSKAIPIVILHGLLGSKRNWDSMSKGVAEALNTCTVVADARNHGESPHARSHNYHDLASDVSKLLGTLQFKRASIIGHSMGGRTAMVLALTEPDLIERLVIVDISPVSTAGLQNSFFPNLIDVMKSVNFAGVNNLSQARAVARDKILKSGVIKRMEGMNFILLNLAMRPDNKAGWVCNLDALKQSFTDIASFPAELKTKKFYGPTLFIGGEKSVYLSPNDFDGIRNIFPNAELTYVPGVGHNIHVEDPDTFLKIVKEFLAN